MPVIPLIVDDSQAEKVEAARIAGARKVERGVLQVGEAWKTVSASSRDGLVGMTAQVKAFNAETRGMLKSLDAIQRQLKASEGASKQAANGVRTHGRASLDAGEKAAGYAKRLEIANRLVQKHGIESGVAKKIVASFGSNLGRADRQALGYATRLDKAQKSALAFAAAQKKAAADVRAVASAERKAAADTARLAAQQDKAAATAARQAAATRGLVGRLVGLAVAYGGVRVAARAIGGSSVEFGAVQTALVSVKKTTDLTREGMRGLNEDVTELATGAVPILKTELLAVGAAAGQVGVEGRENIAEQIELFGKLSVAAESIDADEAVVELTRLRNVQGELIDVTETQVNVLVRLGNEFAANEREIIGHTSEVGRATSQFKIGSVNALAFGTALAAMGARAEGGGTAIGRAMREMQAAVSEGGEGLEAFAKIAGTTSEEFARQWREDNVAALKTFLAGLGEFGEDSAQALATVGLESDRLAKVLPVLAENIGLLERAQATAADEAGKLTALNEEASAAFDTQDNDIKRLVNTYKFLQEQVGGEVTPAVREMAAEWAMFIADVDAVALGRALADALRLASDGALFLAENADILKAAMLALLTIQIGSFLSGLAAKHLAAAAAAGTQAVAVNGLTAAQARFLSVGLTPMTVGLAAVLGAVLLANKAIKDLSRTYEKEMADMVKATNAFADSRKKLGVDTGDIIDRGDLQEMSDALGIQTNMLDEARAAADGYQAEMQDLAAQQEAAGKVGNRFAEEQKAAALAFGEANTKVGDLEKSTGELKDALSKWTPEVEKAGGAADDFGEELKTVAGAMEKLQAQAVRQQSVALAMSSLGVSAAQAGTIVSTLTDIQKEAGLEGLAAADAVARMLGQTDNATVMAIRDLVLALDEEKDRLAAIDEMQKERLKTIREIARLEALTPGRERPVGDLSLPAGFQDTDFGDTPAIPSGGDVQGIKRAETFGKFLTGLDKAGGAIGGSAGFFASEVANAGQVFSDKTATSAEKFAAGAFLATAAIEAVFGGDRGGTGGIGSFGGRQSDTLRDEGAALGSLFGPAWAALGGAIGGQMKISAEAAVAKVEQVGDQIVATVLAEEGGLAPVTREIAAAIQSTVGGFFDQLGGIGTFLGSASIEVTGDNEVTAAISDEFGNLIVRQFADINEAIKFTAVEIIRRSQLSGVGEFVQAAFEGLVSAQRDSNLALDKLDPAKLDALFGLAQALDNAATNAGPLSVAMRGIGVELKKALQIGLDFELPLGPIFDLFNEQISDLVDGVNDAIDGLFGVTDRLGPILELQQAAQDIQVGITDAEQERVERLEELKRRQVVLEAGETLGGDAGAGLVGPLPGITPVAPPGTVGIIPGLGDAADEIAETLGDVGGAISGGAGDITDGAGGLILAAGDIGAAGVEIASQAAGLSKGVADAAGGLGGAPPVTGTATGGTGGAAGGTAGDVGLGLFDPDVGVLQGEVDAGTISLGDMNKMLGDTVNNADTVAQQLEDVNTEIAALEEGLGALPDAVDPQRIADAFNFAATQVATDLANMLNQIGGIQSSNAQLEAARQLGMVFTLNAQLEAVRNMLAATDLLTDASRNLLTGLLAQGEAALQGLIEGSLSLKPKGGGGGGRKEARESVRDFFDDLRQEAAQTAPGVLALGDRLEEFRDQMAEARRLSALTGEEMSQAWKDFLTVGARVANEGVRGALDAVAGIGDFQAALRDSAATFADSRAQFDELIRVAELQGLSTEALTAQREALNDAEAFAVTQLAGKLSGELSALGVALDPKVVRELARAEFERGKIMAINSVLAAQAAGLLTDVNDLLEDIASAEMPDPSAISGQFDNLRDLMDSIRDSFKDTVMGIGESFDALRENAIELEASEKRLAVIEEKRIQTLMDLAANSQAAVAGDLAAADGIGKVGTAMDDSTVRFDRAEKEMRQVMAAIAAAGGSTEELADQIGKLGNAERVTARGIARDLIGAVEALGIALPVEVTQRLAAAQFEMARMEILAALATKEFTAALAVQGVSSAEIIKLVIAGPQPGKAGGTRGGARGAGRSASASSGEDLEALRRDVLALMEGFRRMRLGPVASQAANLAQQLKDVMDKAKRTSIDLGAVAEAFDVARQAFIKTSLDTIGPPPDFNETANALTDLEETFVDVLAGFMIIGASAEDMADAGERFALAAAEIEFSAKEGIRGRIKDLEHLNTTQTNLDVFVGAKDRFEALAATALDMSLTNAERADALGELAGASTDFENEIKAFLGAGPTSQALLDEMLLTLKEVNAANILVVTDRDILEAQAASLAEIELTTAAQPTATSSASSFSALGTSIETGLEAVGGGLLDPLLLEELIAAFENEGLTVTELSALITQIGAVPFAEMTAALADSPIAVAEEVAKITAALGADAFADVVDALGGLGFADLVIALDDVGLDFVGFADELAGIDLTGLSFDEITDALGPFGPIAELLGPELFNKLVLALAPVTTGTGTTATALTTESGLLVNKMNSVRLNTNADGPLHKRLGKGNDRTGPGTGDLSVQGHLAALNANLNIPGFESGGFIQKTGLVFAHENEFISPAGSQVFDAGAFVTPVPVPISAPRSDDSEVAAKLERVEAMLKKLFDQREAHHGDTTTNQGAMIEELIEGNVTADKIAASTGAKASKVETSRDRAP